MNLKFKNGLKGVIPNAILMLYSITCVFPAIWLFYSGMKQKSEFYANPVALPAIPSMENYIDILTRSNILVWIGNSFRNTFSALFCILLIGFVTGYFLSRFAFRGRGLLYSYFLLGMLVPIHALMVPMYVLFTKLGIHNQWFTLILPYTAFGLPICVFLVESYMKSVPIELEEAAAIDGSSFTRTLFSIILPICAPVLVTVGIIQFFTMWNEFTFALILIDSDKLVTVPLGITLFKGQFSTNYPKMMAVMLISIIPTMTLYFIFSKQIIKGMVAGAVKG